MRKSISKILAASEPKGNLDVVQQFAAGAADSGAQAIALLGSLTTNDSDPQVYSHMLKALGETQLPAFYIPGVDDVPFAEFLRAAANFELVYPRLRGVHGTFAMASSQVLVSGMGGKIDDDPKSIRSEVATLCYPAWEVEYHLKFLHELKDYQKVFLFTTAPEHKGRHEQGSSILAEIIKTYNPRMVLVPGEDLKKENIGKSLVVRLPSLADGTYVLVDLSTLETRSFSLHESMRAA